MVQINQYIKCSKISEVKFREIVKHFVADLSATQITTLSGISRNSINKYIMEIHHRIYDFCSSESPFIYLDTVELGRLVKFHDISKNTFNLYLKDVGSSPIIEMIISLCYNTKIS